MAPRVILIGAPGAGKTTVGTALAARLTVPFADTDQLVVDAAGKSVPEIFFDDGEPAFRALEVDAVRRGLDSEAGVLALGGGAVTTEAVRDLLRGRPVVWLRVSAATAAARAGLQGGRPLLMGNPRARLRELLLQREPWYREVARWTVEADGRTPSALAGAIAELVDPTPAAAPAPADDAGDPHRG